MIHRIHALTLACIVALGCGAADDRWGVERISTRAGFRGICFIDPDRGFVVGGDYFIDGGIIGATDDGGRTWSFQSDLVSAKAGFTLNDVVFLDRFIGIAAGSHGVILRTTDRGRNWVVARPYSGGTDHFHDLHFLDESHGWAVGFNGIVRTTDGGQNWSWLGERRAISGAAVHFFDLERGLVAGKHGRISMTGDGGETWIPVTDPGETGTEDLLTMTFFGPIRGWAGGTNGAILHTRDGGRSWKRQPTGARGRVTDLVFVDPNLGWALVADRSTSSSTILHTIDGGETWREAQTVEGELLNALTFFDSTRGWAVGERPEHGPQVVMRYRAD